MSIVEENGAQGHKTPNLMAALLKLQSKILKRQGGGAAAISALQM